MKEIKTLTAEEKILMEKYREEWHKLSLSTEPCNKELSEIAITKMYAKLKLPKPTFHWHDSPLQAMLLINKMLNNETNKYIQTHLLGNQDSYWIAFYLFCRDIKIDFTEEQSEILDIWKDIALNCGWWYAYDTDCFCVQRPVDLHFNERGQLHNENGPAIGYRDGFKLYSVRGVAVPAYVIEHPEKITVEKIDKEKNIEIRRIMQDRMGISKYLEESGAVLVHMDMIPVGGIDDDTYMPRALMKDKEGRQFLVGTDSSTQNKVFYMQVDPNAKTCSEAHQSISNIPDEMIIANG
jgi:hypothetical protein